MKEYLQEQIETNKKRTEHEKLEQNQFDIQILEGIIKTMKLLINFYLIIILYILNLY